MGTMSRPRKDRSMLSWYQFLISGLFLLFWFRLAGLLSFYFPAIFLHSKYCLPSLCGLTVRNSLSPPESESGSADFLDLHDLNQSYPLIMVCLMFGIQPDLLAVSAGRFEVFKVPLLVSFSFPLLLLDEIREILQDGTEVGAVTRIPCTPEKSALSFIVNRKLS